MKVGVDFALKVLELDDVNVHLQLWCVFETKNLLSSFGAPDGVLSRAHCLHDTDQNALHGFHHIGTLLDRRGSAQ